MSRKAYFLPITDSLEGQVALDQLQAAGIEINFAVIGPQLTCNVRSQGGNDADVGQRPQRLNRAPLPV